MTQARDPQPAAALLQLATGSWITQALYVVAQLGVADHLRDGPKSCDALAAATGSHAGALYRVLRALASIGVFARDNDGRFRLTPMAEHLRSDHDASLRGYILMLGGDEVWRSWGDAMHSVRTGEPAFDHVFGAPLFEYYSKHPEPARISAAAMTSRSTQENHAVLSAYDFAPAAAIIDVAGGQGTLLAAILRKNPAMRGTLFDMPHVIAAARPALEKGDVGARCALTSGDFFKEIPAGADVYVMKRIIHDWDDERARAILRNCRAAIPAGGRLLLIEMVIPSGDEPSPGNWLDLNMLVLTGGLERTESEYDALLASAGFQLRRIVATPSAVSVIEATPA